MTNNEIIMLGNQLNTEVSNFLGMRRINIFFDPNWNAKSSNGCYYYSDRVLKISKYLVKDQDIKEVILHELCHAYDTERSGHKGNWKKLAAKVGKRYDISITRCSNREKDLPVLAIIKCNNCGNVWEIKRKIKIYRTEGKGYHCPTCGEEKGRLTFTKLI